MFRYLLVAITLLPIGAEAQRTRGGSVPVRPSGVEINVRILFDNSRPAGSTLRVQLLSGGAIPLTEAYSDSTGQVRFRSIRPGNYRLRVTGIGIEETETDLFTVDALEVVSMQMVTVRREKNKEEVLSAQSGAPISQYALNIPDKANREFDKGREQFEKKKNDEAMRHLVKAAEIYPHYAEAFDLMGVITAPASRSEAKNYFEQAIKADENFFPSYPHLAKTHIQDKNWTEAERLLVRATTLDPRSAESMFLLAYSQLMQNRLQDAVKTSERTHQLEHDQFVLVHFVAGEAYARQGKRQEAIDQYLLYLKEAPLGPSVAQAKEAIRLLNEQAKN